MICLHLHCPMGTGLGTWQGVVDDPRLKVRAADRIRLLADITAHSLNIIGTAYLVVENRALLARVLK